VALVGLAAAYEDKYERPHDPASLGAT